jgi:hypothetical protein
VTDEATHTWSPTVEKTMRAAGWHEGRRVDTRAWREELESEGWVMHPAAATFLTEFGGLAVRASGPGRDVARMSFEFDPVRCSGQKDWFDSLDESTGGELYPLGEEANGNASLAIDVDGVVHLLLNFRRVTIGRGRTAPARLIEGERD